MSMAVQAFMAAKTAGEKIQAQERVALAKSKSESEKARFKYDSVNKENVLKYLDKKQSRDHSLVVMKVKFNNSQIGKDNDFKREVKGALLQGAKNVGSMFMADRREQKRLEREKTYGREREINSPPIKEVHYAR